MKKPFYDWGFKRAAASIKLDKSDVVIVPSNTWETFEKEFPQREIEGRINEDTWLGTAPTPKEIKTFISSHQAEMVRRLQTLWETCVDHCGDGRANCENKHNEAVDAAIALIKKV